MFSFSLRNLSYLICSCSCIGAPLSEADLTPNEELGQEIKRWIIMRSTNAAAAPAVVTPAVGASTAATDDLYDF